MQGLLAVSRSIDRILKFFATVGGWLGAVLVFVVCYDVVTRYFGVPKFFGFTSTMLQESEYWLHSFLIVFCVGWAYTRNAHVRIDLLRDGFSNKTKYRIEILGNLCFLLPYTAVGVWIAWPYMTRSFLSGEISDSQTGLSNLWILKAGLLVLFILLALASISQLIKSFAGLRGALTPDEEANLLGGGH
ncbi:MULTISPECIES: TRAP transporter small permease subunit [Halocynthiibacter]|uniref:TRAP transporter small permease protein n=1 Tax=Halocynthiibacter halioticoli TaxID=2986804 RepID=A0AAE3IWN5_9RHOB|nr:MULTISPECIES: TRAP transporter small permease subunit [Halocynthiibacter]MCV6823359.1 TRAP transporter small permease subunit [Halocynthiibacter halioticoli]MCW4056360.1 TRAP transporter small permease subunit [Halocynthiibacter sp. SDUM655004]MDE0590674.1 TRAP transporter small permease subunit [Halocynthiibacter sp. C4]